MLRTCILFLSACSLIVAGPVLAQQDQASDVESKAETKQAKAVVVEVPSTDDDRIKCRKFDVIGSLVQKEKVCKTMAQWREFYYQGNRNARDIVDATQKGNTNGR